MIDPSKCGNATERVSNEVNSARERDQSSADPHPAEQTDKRMLSELIAQNQRNLGALIARPKLTEKLLLRPPVKFLYDIVMEVSIVTGFGAEIVREISAERVVTREAKLEFVTLSHSSIEHALHRRIDVDPSKETLIRLTDSLCASTKQRQQCPTGKRSSEAFNRARNREPLLTEEELDSPTEDGNESESESSSADVKSDDSCAIGTRCDVQEEIEQSSDGVEETVAASAYKVKAMLSEIAAEEKRLSQLFKEIDTEFDQVDAIDAVVRVKERRAEFSLLKLCASTPVPQDDEPNNEVAAHA
ncbi:conserved hypothetical protein [Perkinsus marinus ATCC 50983]|uniref:TRAF3-interacting protein 1 N-terminal domain-containing protein n=1 Tax=Perkinsus marinus (strain ATCC 50983 / TXsc) TaxID=423536 RepID=C5LAK2_PERM5|nr:conserved hypothetical protein [Perkinsus marinus ATCC 50983]EER06458.1 conserved hypothetical protein [Perkinsus marinus ATCC 50983]|eukprot:XP_002774642.1 conserved hypothetical protein [Perkinsus marinus ATCC 50983]